MKVRIGVDIEQKLVSVNNILSYRIYSNRSRPSIILDSNFPLWVSIRVILNQLRGTAKISLVINQF